MLLNYTLANLGKNVEMLDGLKGDNSIFFKMMDISTSHIYLIASGLTYEMVSQKMSSKLHRIIISHF